MSKKVIYLKIDENIKLNKKDINIEDIAKLYCTDNSVIQRLNKLKVYQIQSEEEIKIAFSILKIIAEIVKNESDYEVVNLGETDFVVSYEIPKKRKQIWEYCKTGFVGLIVFFGGAFSIVSFNADIGVSDLFMKARQLVTGSSVNTNNAMEIGYSLGIPLGILVFYNHFSKFKLNKDPTPIQMEMRKYENDINGAIIDDANREDKTVDVD